MKNLKWTIIKNQLSDLSAFLKEDLPVWGWVAVTHLH